MWLLWTCVLNYATVGSEQLIVGDILAVDDTRAASAATYPTRVSYSRILVMFSHTTRGGQIYKNNES